MTMITTVPTVKSSRERVILVFTQPKQEDPLEVGFADELNDLNLTADEIWESFSSPTKNQSKNEDTKNTNELNDLINETAYLKKTEEGKNTPEAFREIDKKIKKIQKKLRDSKRISRRIQTPPKYNDGNKKRGSIPREAVAEIYHALETIGASLDQENPRGQLKEMAPRLSEELSEFHYKPGKKPDDFAHGDFSTALYDSRRTTQLNSFQKETIDQIRKELKNIHRMIILTISQSEVKKIRGRIQMINTGIRGEKSDDEKINVIALFKVLSHDYHRLIREMKQLMEKITDYRGVEFQLILCELSDIIFPEWKQINESLNQISRDSKKTIVDFDEKLKAKIQERIRMNK